MQLLTEVKVPTLYHYRCSHCGLNYFGKTVNSLKRYFGSGTRWSNHIKKHNSSIEVVTIYNFDTFEDCQNFAAAFSEENNIVESTSWANLRPEDGGAGLSSGWKMSEEHKRKISTANSGKKRSLEYKRRHSVKMKGKSAWNKGLSLSGDIIQKISESNKRYRQTAPKDILEASARKISIANKGKPKPNGHGEKVSKSQKGRDLGPIWREKNRRANQGWCFVHNEEINTKIKLDQLDSFLAEGWSRGINKSLSRNKNVTTN